MLRLRSAVPLRVRILLVVLLFAAWQAETLLLHQIAASRVTANALTALKSGPIPSLARALSDFIADGLSAITANCELLFDALPAAVRGSAPVLALIAIGRALATLFGIGSIAAFAAAMLRLGGELIRILVALNVAGWLYNILRRFVRWTRGLMMLPMRFYADDEGEGLSEAGAADGAPQALARLGGTRRREYVEFFGGHVERIGIILPGGGARGVYQAGALKAIYDFLREYNALNKVCMFAATSTGAWNAMFWLAGMMDPASASVTIESWWKQSSFSRLMEFPWLWLPFFGNYRFSCEPWHEQFFELFQSRLDHLFTQSPQMHFYFTRADIKLGALGYATNWNGLRQRLERLGLENQDNYRLADVIGPDGHQLERLAEAIFASLGQAPLFPGGSDKLPFESGETIDPIPVRFAAPLEDCDLVFVLPTHGAPAIAGGTQLARITRLSELQQNSLERFSIKNVDTINRIAERFDRLDFGASAIAASAAVIGVAAEATTGVREEIDEFSHAYKRLYLFTASPAGDLSVDRSGFDQRREAAAAFDLMYGQVRTELQHRLFEDIEPEDARVVLVEDQGPPPEGQVRKPIYRRPSQF